VYQPTLAAYGRSPETWLRIAYQRDRSFAGKHAFRHRQCVRVPFKRKHSRVGREEVRERRTGGPSGRALK